MSQPEQNSSLGGKIGKKALKAAPVIIVGSVMFSFISYWRVAAVVLCDLASTAFYIGGIVEQAIGPAAPWYIMGVMIFSYCVRSVYIESCSLFVRGGVYRVVKEALGGVPAKAAVSALLFDYILTGPISACSAGQYLIGWVLEFMALINPDFAVANEALRANIKQYGSVLIAIAITLYFFRQNLIGIHESSGKALKIMGFTTIVVVIVLIWCGITMIVRGGPVNKVPILPDLSQKFEYETTVEEVPESGEKRDVWKRDPETGKLQRRLDEFGEPIPKMNRLTGHQEDPLGFFPKVFPNVAEQLRGVNSALSFIGVLGILLAFGHSILAMSGEETMAQVYREIESPKLPNFRKAALVIFTYSLVMTAGISFLAVLIIPDEVRMKSFADNLISGLAMHVVGPVWMRVVLNAVVVGTGFLILSGAVNTSIIGSNGVLNRVAEDGVIPDRLQKPHPKYGTTHRILYVIVGLQMFTIIASGGDMVLLGEAYAFGVIWSFFFNAVSMFMLRFKDRRPREYRVPFNFHIGGVEIPVGLLFVTFVLGTTAVFNLFTKEVATIGGLTFSSILMVIFFVTEKLTHKDRKGAVHEHLEQFTERSSAEVSAECVGSTKEFKKLVAIRSPQNLYMLQRALEETDPESTDVIVMTAKTTPVGSDPPTTSELDRYDRKLMTAVIELAEKSGKFITPMIVPTNNPLFAVVNTAKSLGAQELVVGASNKFTAEEQLDQMVFYWINLHGGEAAPLTIRVLSKTWDFYYDVGGGNRIPRASERHAKTVADLRAAGVGVRRVLMVHDNTHHAHDMFDAVLTMLDPDVVFDLVHHANGRPPASTPVSASKGSSSLGITSLLQDVERAQKIGREVTVHTLSEDAGPAIVKLAVESDYDLIVLDGQAEMGGAAHLPEWESYVREHAPCAVCLLSLPIIQREVVDKTPSAVFSAPIAKDSTAKQP